MSAVDVRSDDPLRIAIIGAARFPICEPFAGGLEAHTWQLATGLQDRGHQVSLYAGAGSDPSLAVRTFSAARAELSDAARADVSVAPEAAMVDHHAYLSTMLDLGSKTGEFDLVHNNSVHHLPLAMSRALPLPQVTTLHTPPTPWLEMAIQTSPGPLPVRFCAVSHHTAAAWRPLVPDAAVVPNAIDLDRWRPGPGGSDAVWSGRIVPEKGLHLAMDAARRAGIALRFAGPALDRRYWAEEIEPRLGSHATWVGHLDHRSLGELVGRSAVALVSPCWEEPFGLVALEALACGTPVAAIARGGLAEVLDPSCSRVAADGGVTSLAEAITGAVALDRGAARARAEHIGSADRMVDDYVAVYRSCLTGAPR